ncbi:Uncharacterised protein [Burkholderia pseudomallei]|uniref:Serine protease n=1 Tax=Burkholderia pseudomallei (strain K96243) TaxID=272560 RepID=Q63PV3_BURPS|nr:hypothetical protein [Burkholderia pseudomallei]AJX26813.1 hypothetical protein AQ15_1640 [Burkholderia pseudomallei K96243]MBD2922449.1 hypothetical protein [Burkholderia pseudomallei]MBD2998235.1 hypothetical protein [Burkholderia pseudomallei]MDE3327376.1 hypothetical protein [Burkholderia pseudomallei]OMR43320.1 hypothetical protein AQ724_07810 [Burkholderia pseudomallei]
MDRDEARALMAGLLGEQLMKFPLRWCKPAFFGIEPAPGEQVEVQNGTASLIVRGEDHFAITCRHVLDGFRAVRAESDRGFFHIGNCAIDPLAQLVIEGQRDLDVAVLWLTPEQAQHIVRDSDGIGESFFRVDQDRPAIIEEGNGVAFAGFPGVLRRHDAPQELNFGSYGCGATPVTAANDARFICQFERAEWVVRAVEAEPATIGGLSGGPAFLIKQSPAGLITYEFAGIIYEYSNDYELLYIVQAAAIFDLMHGGEALPPSER